jgi:hypothetical protein
LFWYDYLDEHEIEKIMNGEDLPKERVRQWDYQKEGEYLIKF